jgi:hypothetical protein
MGAVSWLRGLGRHRLLRHVWGASLGSGPSGRLVGPVCGIALGCRSHYTLYNKIGTKGMECQESGRKAASTRNQSKCEEEHCAWKKARLGRRVAMNCNDVNVKRTNLIRINKRPLWDRTKQWAWQTEGEKQCRDLRSGVFGLRQPKTSIHTTARLQTHFWHGRRCNLTGCKGHGRLSSTWPISPSPPSYGDVFDRCWTGACDRQTLAAAGDTLEGSRHAGQSRRRSRRDS